MTTDIRSIEKNEVCHVFELYKKIVVEDFYFSEAACGYYLETWSEGKILQKSEQEGNVMLAAWVEAEPAGLLFGVGVEGGVGTIVWLLVSRNIRGSGVGKLLFNTACEKYRALGAHKIKLTAPTERAVEFYEKLGMRKEGFHPNHWWNREFWSLGYLL